MNYWKFVMETRNYITICIVYLGMAHHYTRLNGNVIFYFLLFG